MILTTVSRDPAGAVSITWMSLIFGAGRPRMAFSTNGWALSSRGVTRPAKPAAAIDFSTLRRFIGSYLSLSLFMLDKGLETRQFAVDPAATADHQQHEGKDDDPCRRVAVKQKSQIRYVHFVFLILY